MSNDASNETHTSESDWHGELRARGYRLTAQRQLVLSAVRELGHSTPDDITEQVRAKSPSLNISTVYRTLDLLEELGLVTHTHLGHGSPTYHAADDSDHLHLVCRVCGEVSEVDADVASTLVGSLRASHGFEVDVTHVAVQGRCAECAAKE